MATILATFGSGGSHLTPSNGGVPSLALALRDIADDLAAIKAKTNADTTDIAAVRTQVAALVVDVGAHRTAYNATLAKLDADAGVTDTNYAATNPAAALTAAAPAALTGGAIGTLLTLKG